MTMKRKVEVFSSGCPACQDAIKLVNHLSCGSCEVAILDMNDSNVAKRAKSLGIHAVPSVVINGQLIECCSGRGIDEASLRTAGLGQPRPNSPGAGATTLAGASPPSMFLDERLTLVLTPRFILRATTGRTSCTPLAK